MRHLLRAHGDLRVQLAAYRYQNEEISLTKAADIAGVSWAQMRDILLERGIPHRLGPEDIEDALDEARLLRGYFEAGP